MSLHPHIIEPVPDETARVARAAFPKGHPYLTMRDVLGTIFQDDDFAALFPAWGPPGLPPWRLALVTIMQFRENLADRQASEAVRARIDWKYLLSLDLTDPGFDFSVLSEFRDRLLAGHADPVHLVFTDVVMPGMNGRELAARLATLRPGIRVLYTSGYTEDAILRHGVLDDPSRFLGKPYTPSVLRRRIREALDG